MKFNNSFFPLTRLRSNHICTAGLRFTEDNNVFIKKERQTNICVLLISSL